MSERSKETVHRHSTQQALQKAELEFPGRRSFVAALMGLGAVAVGVLLSVPLVMFAFDPLFRQSSTTDWSEAGNSDDFNNLTEPTQQLVKVQQQDGWRTIMSEKPVFVLPKGAGPHRVLSPVCPHLGCQVQWMNGQEHFYCPCHATVFAKDGSFVSGVAARGLDHLESKIEDDKLMVRYQYFRLLVSGREVIG